MLVVILVGVAGFVLASLVWVVIVLLINGSRGGLKVLLNTKRGKTKYVRVTKFVRYNRGWAANYFLKGELQFLFGQDNREFPVIKGHPMVGAYEGNTAAVSVMGDEVPSIGENYMLLLRTHGLSEAYKELEGKKSIPWLWVIIVVVVIVVAFAGYKVMNNKKDVGTPQTSTEQTSPVKSGNGIQVIK